MAAAAGPYALLGAAAAAAAVADATFEKRSGQSSIGNRLRRLWGLQDEEGRHAQAGRGERA
jgi:hypothetical protein